MDTSVNRGDPSKKSSGKGSIDPLNLLECLKVLLNDSGGIMNVQSVHRLVVCISDTPPTTPTPDDQDDPELIQMHSLMGKYSKKLVSKCMYLNILLATDPNILDIFFSSGGWRMVSDWLSEAIAKQNWPLAHVVLELLNVSPITLERLNDTDLAMVKQVKFLSVSCPHTGVTEMAKLLVLHWTRMLTKSAANNNNNNTGSEASPSAAGGTQLLPVAAATGGDSLGPAEPGTHRNMVELNNALHNDAAEPPVDTTSTNCTSGSDINDGGGCLKDTQPDIVDQTAVKKEVSDTSKDNVDDGETDNTLPAQQNTSEKDSTDDVGSEDKLNESKGSDDSLFFSVKSDSIEEDGGGGGGVTTTADETSQEDVVDSPSVKVPPPAAVGRKGATAKQQPKLKNRCKFNATKRVKSSTRSPLAATSSSRTSSHASTVVVKQKLPVLVSSPAPLALVLHVATGLGKVGAAQPIGKPVRGRRRANQQQDTSSDAVVKVIDAPPPPPPPPAAAAAKSIKITIRNGEKVLAKVSSDQKGSKGSHHPISPAFVDTDDDDDDEDDAEEDDTSDDDIWKRGGKKTKKSSPGKAGRTKMEVVSDEDFVVDEWQKKPVNSGAKSKSSPIKKAGNSVSSPQKKRKVRAIIIESDDSMDSLPNIGDEKEAGLAAPPAKIPKLEEGDAVLKISTTNGGAAPAAVSADAVGTDVKAEVKMEPEEEKSKKLVTKQDSIENKKSNDSDKKVSLVKKDEDKKHKDKEKDKHTSSTTSSSSDKKSSKDKERSSKSEKHHGSSSSSSNSSSSKNDKDSDRRKDKDKKSSSDKERKYSGSSSKERERERERRREKERSREPHRKEHSSSKDKDQSEKDKSTMEKIKPLSIDGLAKIPKKPASFLDALGSADGSSGESQVKRPPVKIKSHGFRSTGLLEPVVPRPPGIAGKRNIPLGVTGTTSTTSSTSSHSLSLMAGGLKLNEKYGGGSGGPSSAVSGLPPPRRTEAELAAASAAAAFRPGSTAPLTTVAAGGGLKRSLEENGNGGVDKRLKTTTSSLPASSDRPGGIKLISPKRPPHCSLSSPPPASLSDDGGFMAALDAMSSSSNAEVTKRRLAAKKRRVSGDADGGGASPAGKGSPNTTSDNPTPATAASSDTDTAAATSSSSDTATGATTEKADATPPSDGRTEGILSPSVVRPTLNFYRDALQDLDKEKADPVIIKGKKSAPEGSTDTPDDKEKNEEGEEKSKGEEEDEQAEETDVIMDEVPMEECVDEDNPADETNIEEEAMDISSGGPSPVPPAEDYEKVEVTFTAPHQGEIKSALVLIRQPGNKKKAVRFLPEDKLETMHYFLLDQTERVNVNAQKFQDMLLMEKHGERDAMDKHRCRGNSVVQRGAWKLLPIHLPASVTVVVSGCKSVERHVQAKREYNTMATFFHPNRLPDTPQEADPEIVPRTEPRILPPTDDSASQDAVHNLKGIPWPEPLMGLPPQPPPPQQPAPGLLAHPQQPYMGAGGPAFHMAGPVVGGPQPPQMGMHIPGGPPPVMGGRSFPPSSGDYYPVSAPIPEAVSGSGSGGGHWILGSAAPGVNGGMPPQQQPPPVGVPPSMGEALPGVMYPGGAPMMPPHGYPGPIPPGMGPPMGNYGPPPGMDGGGWGGEQDDFGRYRDGGFGGGRYGDSHRRGGGGGRGVDRRRGRGGGWRGKVSNTPCRHFIIGNCRNGDDCPFSHRLD